MSKPQLYIFGLGAGSADDLTVGTLRTLRNLSEQNKPLLLRTDRHPSVQVLVSEGIHFTRSFDIAYETHSTFDEVYSSIVDNVLATVRENDVAGYLVPGHPMLGEQSVRLLLAHSDEIEITLSAGTSFIDACLEAARFETAGLVILDALTLPDPTNVFRKFASPYSPYLPHLIYQVYDRDIASRTKLSLLERYEPDFEVFVLASAGVLGAERVIRTPLSRLDHSSNTFDHLTSVLVPANCSESLPTDFTTLLDIMAQLRNPTTGCPWDKEQTPQSLKRFAVEEVYEVLDAIDDGDSDKYVEELGDLLLQVAFHAQLARESGEFEIGDVIASISEKLIRRHPHVFGDTTVTGSADVLVNWEIIKSSEKNNSDRKSRLDGVPRHLPALYQALEISKKAAKAGFEWNSIEGVFEKLEEEIVELKDAISKPVGSAISDELGDLLFTVVNIARFAKIDPEDALRTMVKRFCTRFRAMERLSDKPLEELKSEQLEQLWQAAKREESK